jgi:MFS transporter, DHA2 family, glioxin efflux transporter
LIAELPFTAPGVNPAAVIATGATQIRTAFSEDQIPGILVAYMASIKVAFAIAIGSVGVAFVVSLFSTWKRLNPEAMKMAGGAA